VPLKRALITGVSGQDGSYLAQFLLDMGYEVHGLIHKNDGPKAEISDLLSATDTSGAARLQLHVCDIRDSEKLTSLISLLQPDEMYNLAAQSHVALSFAEPELTHDVNCVAVDHMLRAIATMSPDTRFFQASSSEMFGLAPHPQNESSSMLPQSPYGLTKKGAHGLVLEAREERGIFATSGILFNHESPRRPLSFVTRKITSTLAAIRAGKESTLTLGNLDAVRDWGYAPEYVEGMWLSLQAPLADDFVFATGQGRTVREFLGFAAEAAGVDAESVVEHKQDLERPLEVRHAVGDATKAQAVLGWRADTTARELAELMVEADLARNGREDAPLDWPRWRITENGAAPS
jgi:GDPmannose 4,6-dehydratase